MGSLEWGEQFLMSLPGRNCPPGAHIWGRSPLVASLWEDHHWETGEGGRHPLTSFRGSFFKPRGVTGLSRPSLVRNRSSYHTPVPFPLFLAPVPPPFNFYPGGAETPPRLREGGLRLGR